jgi:hypothetical protein
LSSSSSSSSQDHKTLSHSKADVPIASAASPSNADHWLVKLLQPIHVFATAETTEYMRAAFPYCFPKTAAPPPSPAEATNAKEASDEDVARTAAPATGDDTSPCHHSQVKPIPRFVPKIAWNGLRLFEPALVGGLEVVPLPVEHGPDFISLAFAFGKEDWVLYISDVSRSVAGLEQSKVLLLFVRVFLMVFVFIHFLFRGSL